MLLLLLTGLDWSAIWTQEQGSSNCPGVFGQEGDKYHWQTAWTIAALCWILFAVWHQSLSFRRYKHAQLPWEPGTVGRHSWDERQILPWGNQVHERHAGTQERWGAPDFQASCRLGWNAHEKSAYDSSGRATDGWTCQETWAPMLHSLTSLLRNPQVTLVIKHGSENLL